MRKCPCLSRVRCLLCATDKKGLEKGSNLRIVHLKNKQTNIPCVHSASFVQCFKILSNVGGSIRKSVQFVTQQDWMMGDISCILRPVVFVFFWQSQSHQHVYHFCTSQQPEVETLCTKNVGNVNVGRHRNEEKTTSVCVTATWAVLLLFPVDSKWLSGDHSHTFLPDFYGQRDRYPLCVHVCVWLLFHCCTWL